ncbi:uncharacterized protein LOC143047159 isoform X2 [Mytilus galloprovincialis]|uniref:uncharacterized protein LOC143047159 isoform X2 n=1 Tax=Mytilus galloprovincialis TaxID=29158 RepID=UPI003F7BAB7A
MAGSTTNFPNVQRIRDMVRNDLASLLDSFKGKKDLVLDTELMKPLDRVAGATMLKQRHVDKIFKLDPTQKSIHGCEQRVYLVRPQMTTMKVIADHVNSDRSSNIKREYRIIMVPRKLHVCEMILEHEGVMGYITIHELQMDLIPLDRDILSLELPQFFRSFYLMKRIHLTTKPSKIKRTVFDGASSKFKTKHVRMTYNGSDVSNSNNINQEVTNQLAQIDYPADQFDFQCEDNVNSNPGRINLTYAEKRKRVMGAWDLLRDKLIDTRLEEQSPATHCCCFCESSVDDVIFCQDCGPSAYYCDTCCKRIHQNILFHKPHQWKQTMYVPIQMTNELARKDHICESSYSTSIYAVDVYNIHVKSNYADVKILLSLFLRYSLWPATPTSPKIGFDLRFMELLSVLQLECCLPAKSFCDALDAMHSNYIKLISNVVRKKTYIELWLVIASLSTITIGIH